MTPPPPIQAVDRALRLLRAIAEAAEPPSATELAALAGVNRSTAWRLLATLEHHDLVQRDPASGTYRVAYGTVRLGAGTRIDAVARRVRPALEWLARETGESVQVTVQDAGALRIVDEIVAASVLTVRWRDRLLPLETSSVGKLVLALRPEAELEAFLRRPLERRTPRSITDPDAFRRAVAEARRTGIATSLGEYELELNGFSAAVVDAGVAVAFISVSGPASRVPAARLPELAPLLLEAAARAGRLLGAGR